jgi:hypothetical protein
MLSGISGFQTKCDLHAAYGLSFQAKRDFQAIYSLSFQAKPSRHAVYGLSFQPGAISMLSGISGFQAKRDF